MDGWMDGWMDEGMEANMDVIRAAKFETKGPYLDAMST